jgi:hypothetical protein
MFPRINSIGGQIETQQNKLNILFDVLKLCRGVQLLAQASSRSIAEF